MYNRNTYFCMQINILSTKILVCNMVYVASESQDKLLYAHFSKKVVLAFEGRGVRTAKILPILRLKCFILFESMALILNISWKNILINLCWCHPMFQQCFLLLSVWPLTRTFLAVTVPTAVLISCLIAWWDCNQVIDIQLCSTPK